MDLFHFDTTNLEPAEVDFVVATLQKRDRRQFVKLPWDSKTKTAVLRQQPLALPPQRLGGFSSGSQQSSAGSRHGGGRRSAMHIPAREKPPRLQRGPQHSSHADGFGRLPPSAALSSAGASEVLSPSSSAQLLGPAAYSAAAAAHLPFVKELHRQHQQHHPHLESAMGRYYMLPGSDEMAAVASPPMEFHVNYMHSGGSMVAGMTPMRHHTGEVPSLPPGMCHHHSHPIMMPPGSISMTAHGGSYTVQHMAPAVRPGHFQMQPPYMSASDFSQLPPGYYPRLPTAGPPMAGGPPMDVILDQPSMYHHHQLPMPPYPSGAQYSMAPSSVPAAMMMPMTAMLPAGHTPTCVQGLAVNFEHPGGVLLEGVPLSCSGLSTDNELPQVHEAMATILQPPHADDAASAAAAAAAPSEAPAPAACEVAQLPVSAATAAGASIPTMGFHSRQSSSGSATSDESLPLDSNCATGKVYERRNKKKRPADFYDRLKPEQQVQSTVTDIAFSASAGAGHHPCASSVAAEQPGLQQKDSAGTPKSSNDETMEAVAVVVENDGCSSTSVTDYASQLKLHQQQPVAAVNQGDSLQAVIVPARLAQNLAPSVETVAAGPAKTVASDVPNCSPTSANSTPEGTTAAAAAAQPAQASTKDAPAGHAAPMIMPSLAAVVSAPSVVAPGVGSRTPGPMPATGAPTATMSWAQRVQMQPGRGAVPQQQAHDATGQRTAAAGIAGTRIIVQQPTTSPRSGDLGALLAVMELSSRPCAVHPRGFINKGNWCYANATLQALLACPMFYNFLAALPKDPALCAAGASKTPLLDALVALCSEFSRFERGSHSTSAATAASPAASKASAVATAAPTLARQPLLDLKPGPPLEPSIVSRLVQTMLSNSSAAFAHGKQEDAEEFHSALLDKLHNELLDAIKAAMPADGTLGTASRPTSAATSASAADLASTSELDASSVNGSEVEWARVGPKNKHVVTRTADLARSPVTAIFGGKLLSSVTQVGSSKTANVEPFLAVQLEIQSDDITSVTKALSALAKRETIDGYTCAKTRQEIETHRRLVFEELPQVLILHLKCFVYDKNGLQKITKKIEFGETLSFSSDLLAFPNKYSLSQRTYKLCAVVHHSGTAATGGHYTTDAFHSGVNCWVRYDDSNISIVSSQSVFEFAAPRMPYLLYYQRCDSYSAA